MRWWAPEDPARLSSLHRATSSLLPWAFASDTAVDDAVLLATSSHIAAHTRPTIPHPHSHTARVSCVAVLTTMSTPPPGDVAPTPPSTVLAQTATQTSPVTFTAPGIAPGTCAEEHVAKPSRRRLAPQSTGPPLGVATTLAAPGKTRKRPRTQALRRPGAALTAARRSGALPTARRLWGPGDVASTTPEEHAFWEALPLGAGATTTDGVDEDVNTGDTTGTPLGDCSAAEEALSDAAKALEAETAAMFKARWGFDVRLGEPVPDGGGSGWTWSSVEA